jgi:hypothetical protein
MWRKRMPTCMYIANKEKKLIISDLYFYRTAIILVKSLTSKTFISVLLVIILMLNFRVYLVMRVYIVYTKT